MGAESLVDFASLDTAASAVETPVIDSAVEAPAFTRGAPMRKSHACSKETKIKIGNANRKTHCKRGHELTPENRHNGGGCKACHKILMTKWYEEHREEKKEQDAKYREKNKVAITVRYKVYQQGLSKEEKEEAYKRKQNVRLISIGWTQERVDEVRILQNNRCAICNEEFTRTPHADHKHVEPPIPRGLLCGKHNQAIGLLGDDPALLRKAAEYIEKYKIIQETQNGLGSVD
jgi:hypothetical protein